MAKTFLGANESYSVLSDTTIVGGGGTETVKIYNSPAVVIDSNIERVELSKALASYTFKATGNVVTVYDGAVAVATITVRETVAGSVQTKAAFTDGSAFFVIGATGTITLGGVTVPTTAAAVAATLDTTDKSTVTGTVGPVVGQSYTLTTAAQTITTTAGNDTIDGSTTLDSLSAASVTKQVIDSTTTDNDTLNATVTGNINPSSIVNIENVNITAKYGSATVDGTKYTGTKILTVDSTIGAGSVTVNGAANSTIASVKASTNVTSLTVASGTSGTGSAGVTVNAGTAPTVALTGTASKDDIFALTVNGGSTTLTATTLADTNDKVTITGATAANTITFGGTAAGPKTIVAAGDQDMTLKADADVLTGNTVTNSLATGKNLNVVITAQTTASGDLSKVAATSIELQATSTGNTFANGANVKLNTTGAEAFVAATGATTVNIDLMQATTGNLTSGATVFTTVNATANTANVTALKAGFGTTTTLNLSGSKNVTMTAANTTLKLLDATNLTGILTATADANTFKINGGSGADVLTITDANKGFVINAGSGNDTVNIDSLAAVTLASAVTVDGGTGTDTLKQTTAASNFNTATVSDSVITGFETIDVNGLLLTLTQKQIFTNGTAFTITDTAGSGTFKVAMNTASSTVLDLSTVSFTGGVAAPSIVLTGVSGATSNTITGTTAADSISGGSTVDILNGGTGNDSILAGAGADKINVGTGVDRVQQHTIGDSGTFTSTTANTTSTTAFDVVTGMAAGDYILISPTGGSGYSGATSSTAADNKMVGTLVTASDLSSLAVADNKVVFVKGTYDSSANTFVGAAAGTDTLVVYDSNALTATQSYEAVVLVGYSGTSVTFATAGSVLLG